MFENEIKSHLENPNLPLLAHELAKLGCGRNFFNGILTWPSETLNQQFNEMVHHLLKEYNLLNTMRGFFEYDCTLDEDHPHKILSKGADQDIVSFLTDIPDQRYFTNHYFTYSN